MFEHFCYQSISFFLNFVFVFFTSGDNSNLDLDGVVGPGLSNLTNDEANMALFMRFWETDTNLAETIDLEEMHWSLWNLFWLLGNARTLSFLPGAEKGSPQEEAFSFSKDCNLLAIPYSIRCVEFGLLLQQDGDQQTVFLSWKDASQKPYRSLPALKCCSSPGSSSVDLNSQIAQKPTAVFLNPLFSYIWANLDKEKVCTEMIKAWCFTWYRMGMWRRQLDMLAHPVSHQCTRVQRFVPVQCPTPNHSSKTSGTPQLLFCRKST